MKSLSPLVRRFRDTGPRDTTFCDSCGQVCTPACRADAQLGRARDVALRAVLGH